MSNSAMSKICATLSALFLAAATLAAPSLAQGTQAKVRVNVPFAFDEGTAHHDAGIYTISLEAGRIMTIHGAQDSSLSLVRLEGNLNPVRTSKVVFRRYGNRYFLRQVWTAGSSDYLDCGQSKAEKKLQKELQIASRGADAQGVEVALLEMPN